MQLLLVFKDFTTLHLLLTFHEFPITLEFFLFEFSLPTNEKPVTFHDLMLQGVNVPISISFLFLFFVKNFAFLHFFFG
jgi:hypothetical protein